MDKGILPTEPIDADIPGTKSTSKRGEQEGPGFVNIDFENPETEGTIRVAIFCRCIERKGKKTTKDEK